MSPLYTGDWLDSDLVVLSNVCNELDCSVTDLLSVMYSESGCHTWAHNPNGDASGLLQFMPKTLRGLGWLNGDAAFRQLPVYQQLPFVRRYMAPYAPKGLTSVSRVYLAVFLPAFLDEATSPDYVLVDKNKDAWNRMVFNANAGFDADKNLQITLGELGQAVTRNCRGPRFSELVSRATGASATISGQIDQYDLRTTEGLQRALVRLGYDPGIIDGIPGMKTHAAVWQFQQDHSLVQDGIPGPRTRATMALALKALPSSPVSTI